MSEAILKAIKDHADTTATELQALRDTQNKLEHHVIDMAQKSATPTGWGVTHTKSVAEKVSDDGQLAALRSRTTKSVIIPMSESIQMLRKSVVGDAGDVGDTPYNVQPSRATGIMNDPRRPLSVLDLMQRIQVSSNSFEFTALDGFVDAAAYQLAEGDDKALQTMPTELKTAPITTIAVILVASEQVLADAPGLQLFINGRLIYGATQKLEAEIINGAGGTGQINGLLNQATSFTPTVDIATADAIGEAKAALEVAGWIPSVVMMNPTDWQAVRSERNTAGEYVAAGWDSPAGPNIWGTPVVVSAAMPAY